MFPGDSPRYEACFLADGPAQSFKAFSLRTAWHLFQKLPLFSNLLPRTSKQAATLTILQSISLRAESEHTTISPL